MPLYDPVRNETSILWTAPSHKRPEMVRPVAMMLNRFPLALRHIENLLTTAPQLILFSHSAGSGSTA